MCPAEFGNAYCIQWLHTWLYWFFFSRLVGKMACCGLYLCECISAFLQASSMFACHLLSAVMIWTILPAMMTSASFTLFVASSFAEFFTYFSCFSTVVLAFCSLYLFLEAPLLHHALFHILTFAWISDAAVSYFAWADEEHERYKAELHKRRPNWSLVL